MRNSIVVFAGFTLFLFFGTIEIRAEGVCPQDTPKAVMDALLAKFPKARIEKCSRAREGGDVVYDIEFTQEGRNFEADITENGTYVNYERAIDVNNLPKVVRDAVEKRYPKSTMKQVMEELRGKDEKPSAYEVVLLTADKKYAELILSIDGKILEDTGATKQKKGSNSGRTRRST